MLDVPGGPKNEATLHKTTRYICTIFHTSRLVYTEYVYSLRV